MAGYAKKKSVHLRQLRMRYMVLQHNDLHSCKSNKKDVSTETVNLQIYNNGKISADEPTGQIELVCNNNKEKRVLDDLLPIKSLMKSDDKSNNESEICEKQFNKCTADQLIICELYDYCKVAKYCTFEFVLNIDLCLFFNLFAFLMTF